MKEARSRLQEIRKDRGMAALVMARAMERLVKLRLEGTWEACML